MVEQQARPKTKIHWLLLAGLGLMVAALLWWFAYYGQWQGWFELLDVKFLCLSGGAMECDNFQDFIGQSAIPVYSPILWWAGLIAAIVGLYLTRRNRA